MFLKGFERTVSCGVCGCGCGCGGGGGSGGDYVSLPLLPTSLFRLYFAVTSQSLTLESFSFYCNTDKNAHLYTCVRNLIYSYTYRVWRLKYLYDIWYGMVHDMIYYVIWYMIWYNIILYGMVWWYDIIIYMMWYMI
jgi:hypothetical protein